MDPLASHAPEDLLAHAEFLARLARGLTADEARAEDLVQDALVTALERPPREPGALRGWLGRVLRNRAVNARRESTRRAAREAASARPEAQESHAVSVERLELQRRLLDELLALSGAQRTVLYLRYYEDLAPAAIARRLALPVKTVKTRLARGLLALRERLDAHAGGERERWLAALAPLAAPSRGPWARVAALATGGGRIVMAWKVAGLVLVGGALVAGVLLRNGGGPPVVATPAGVSPPAALASAVDGEEGLRLAPAPASRAAATDPVAELRGTLALSVRWSDGTPAAGVTLDVTSAGDPAPREEPARAVTDGRGRALLEGLFAGRLRLHADREGDERELELAAGETLALELVLAPGERVHGRVVDADGVPVAGAGIWLEGLRRPWPDAVRVAESDGSGAFALRDVGPRARIGARARGLLPSNVHDVVELPREGGLGASGPLAVELRLGPAGGGLSGRVVDPEGRPVAGARVQAGERGGSNASDDPGGLRATRPEPAVVGTGADGTFVLPNALAPGWTPVLAQARGAPLWSGGVEVPASGEAELEIVLARPATLAGRVLDAGGGPVAGATVLVGHEEGGGWLQLPFPPPTTRSDADGRYRLELVPPGGAELRATAEDPRLGRSVDEVVLAPGEARTLDLVLDPGLRIGGRVVDAADRPLAGWRVEAKPAGALRWRWYPRQDETDAEGRFHFTNVEEDVHEVTIRRSGASPHASARATARPGDLDLVLVVEAVEPATGSVRGILASPSGVLPSPLELVLWAGERGLFVPLDPATGAFGLEAEAGAHRLVVRSGSRTLLATDLFAVAPGETTELGTLVLAPPGEVEVTLPGVRAQDLERLHLSLDRANCSTEGFRVVDGRLVATDLLPGTWVLSCGESEIYVWREVEVVSGDSTPVELAFRPGLSLGVELEFADLGWQAVEVEVRDGQGTLLGRCTGASWTMAKRFVLPADAGRVLVEARTDTGLAAHGERLLGEERTGREPLRLRLE